MTFLPKIGLPIERSEQESSSERSVWHRGHQARAKGHAGALAERGHESSLPLESETPQARGAGPHSNDTVAAGTSSRVSVPQSFAAVLAKNVAATSAPMETVEPTNVGAPQSVDGGKALPSETPRPGSSARAAKPDASRSDSNRGANVRSSRDQNAAQPPAVLAINVSHEDAAHDQAPLEDVTGDRLEKAPASTAESLPLIAQSVDSKDDAPVNAVPAYDVGPHAQTAGVEGGVQAPSPAPSQSHEHPIVGQVAAPRQGPVLNGTAEKPNSDAMSTRPSISDVPRDRPRAGVDSPALAHSQEGPRQVTEKLERAFSSTPGLSADVEQNEATATGSEGAPSVSFLASSGRAEEGMPAPGSARTVPPAQPSTVKIAGDSSPRLLPTHEFAQAPTTAAFSTAPLPPRAVNTVAERAPSTSGLVDKDSRHSTPAVSNPSTASATKPAPSPRVAEKSSRRDLVQLDVATSQAPVNPLAPPPSVAPVPPAFSKPVHPVVAVAETTAAHPTPLVVSSPPAPRLFRLSDTRRVRAAHLDLAQQSSQSEKVAISPSTEVVGTPASADKTRVSFSTAGVPAPALFAHPRAVARDEAPVGERRAATTPSRPARPGHPGQVAQPAVAQGAPVVPLPVAPPPVGHVQSHPLKVDGRSRRGDDSGSVETTSASSRSTSAADGSDGARRPATAPSSGEAQRTERRDVPASEKSTPAVPLATAVPVTSRSGLHLEAPLPTTQAAVAAQPLYDLASADHSLQASTLGRNAHVHLDTGAAGALSIHLSVRDGVTDLEVEGPAVDKLDLRPEEIRRALAGEGLSLGQFVSRVNETSESRPQQHSTGHSGNGGDTPNNTPADAPAPAAATPFASPSGSSSYGEGRRHWNGDGAEPADRDSLPGSRSGAGGSATPATSGDGPPRHRRGFHVTA